MTNSLIFVVLIAAAVGFFLRTMSTMVSAAAAGAKEPRPRLDQIGARIASVLIYFIGQKKVAEEGPSHRSSKHHLLIFWGFLLITIGTADTLISGVFPSLALARWMPTMLHAPLSALIDTFNLIVLLVIAWAVIRRVFIRPPLIPMNLDAALILGAIASLMITHFLNHGFHFGVALVEAARTGANVNTAAYPLSAAFGKWLAPTDLAAAHRIAEYSYWVHVGIVLTFLNYLPYSKHIHLLGALPNIFTRNLSTRRMDLPKLDLEDENQWGVGSYEQFTWKSLLDTYACTECARCSNYCPAYATGKNLSPMQLVHDIRYEMIDRHAFNTKIDELKKTIAAFEAPIDEHGHKLPDVEHLEAELARTEAAMEAMPPMVGGRIAEDTLWACTTCGACQEVCPVFIEHPAKIIQMRQNLVLAQEKVPAELGRTFRNIERQSNPWGIANDQRMDWAEGLEVRTIEDCPDPDYILWIGCAGAFDARIIKQTRALVKVLAAAGVDYAVLGHQEGCTGDPARRAGNELLFQMQAETNIEVLNSTGVKKVITSCPHCLHTLRHDYPQFGGEFEVIHHTQLIADLLKTGALVPSEKTVDSVTFHDSCYLGRWNREFDAPRQILAALPMDGQIKEMTRSREHGFCCGAGGARMFMEEEAPRVNVNRTDEVLETKVAAVAVACPFCNIMLTDGMKERDREDVQVLDVAELVALSLPDVPVSALVRKRDRADA